MRCHTASYREDTLSGLHACDVFRRGFKTNQNNLFALFSPCNSVVGCKHDFTAGSSGRRAQAFADRSGSLKRLCVKLRVKQSVKVSWVDHSYRFFFSSHTFVNEVAGNLQSSLSRSLAVSCLKHKEFAVFNCKFHILHISVVIFKSLAYVLEFFKRSREFFSHLRDRHRRSYAGNNVLALCVCKEFAHKLLFACCRITGKRNACTAVVAHVSESH